MPKNIDYADRVEAVREVSYEIVAQDGVDALCLDVVADRLVMSPRTIQRLIGSTHALPALALQRAERFERNRMFRKAALPSWRSAPLPDRALTSLLEEIPGSVETHDRTVWWRLVLAHPLTGWATAARTEKEAELAKAANDALTEVEDREIREREAARLSFLVTGAVAQVCAGRVRHDVALEIIRDDVRHALERRPDRHAA